MPTPAKKYMYAVMRMDNTSVMYEWTSTEYKSICDSLVSNQKFASFQDGIINLENIRAIVKQEPPKKEKKEVKPLESGTPDIDVQGLQWLKEQKKQMEEWYENQIEEDSELDGGRFS